MIKTKTSFWDEQWKKVSFPGIDVFIKGLKSKAGKKFDANVSYDKNEKKLKLNFDS